MGSGIVSVRRWFAALLLALGVATLGAAPSIAAPSAPASTDATVQLFMSPNASPTTVNIKKPNSIGRVSFSGLANQVIDISTSAGTFTANNKAQLSLENPQGATIAGPVDAGQAGALPQTTLTADGTYDIVITPNPATEIGKVKVNLTSSGAIKSITPNAKGVKYNVSSGGTLDLGTIVGNNTRLSALATGSKSFTGCFSYRITILQPNSSPLATTSACDINDAFIDAVDGTGAGTYKLRIENLGATNGSTTLSIYSFKDQTANITPSATGATVKVKTSGFPGKNVVASFAGTTGQKISAHVTAAKKFVGCFSYLISLIRPDGSLKAFAGACATAEAFMDANELDQTGTWKVVVDPQGSTTGTATLKVYSVTDQAAAITPSAGGATVNVNLTTPGQNAVATFTGAVNQKISVHVTGASGFVGCFSYVVKLFRPDGSDPNFFAGACGTADAFLDTKTLDQAGTWKVVFDPQVATTGTATMKVYEVTDQAAAITPTAGGATVNVNLTTPGQNTVATFTGAVNQKISVHVTGASGFVGCFSYVVKLFRPDGSDPNFFTGACGTADAFMDAVTLDAAGTWKVVFDPQVATTGTATMKVYDVVDQMQGITKGGAAKTVTVATPGKNSKLTFSGSNGENVTVNVTGSTFTGCFAFIVKLIRPDGSDPNMFAGSCGATATLGPVALDATGTWTILFDPQGPTTGTASVELD